MTPQKYNTPSAFKAALEARLRRLAIAKNERFERTRMMLIFDRFLARIVREFTDTVVLKGGLALELRLKRARTTKDVDLRMAGSNEALLSRLQAAGRLDLGDFLSFEIGLNTDHPEIRDAIYEGFRFKSTCLLAGKRYADFGIDIGFGDPMFATPDEITAPDLPDFIGAAPPCVKVYPPETHLAEKLHAYTLPRDGVNMRIKDLPDLPLLGQVRRYQSDNLRAAFAKTFEFRKSHSVPTSLPSPPESWAVPYAKIAHDDGLPWSTLTEVIDMARRFLDPVLEHDQPLVWSPLDWEWSPADAM